jgi:hypothetical protein
MENGRARLDSEYPIFHIARYSMRVLTEKSEVERAMECFKTAVCAVGPRLISTRIGRPDGTMDASVQWLPTADIWAYFGLPPGRSADKYFWNVFGVGKPGDTVNITCEINPPISGIRRQVQGAFVESTLGQVYVVHRGSFNAFRGRIPKDFVLDQFQGRWLSVIDGERTADVLCIGNLSDSNFVDDLQQFVLEVARIKELYKASQVAD